MANERENKNEENRGTERRERRNRGDGQGEREKSPYTERVVFINRVADRKSTRLNSSHMSESRMPSSA